MIPEWECSYTYQFGDAVWYDDVIHYCLDAGKIHREPGYQSKYWTTDKSMTTKRVFGWEDPRLKTTEKLLQEWHEAGGK